MKAYLIFPVCLLGVASHSLAWAQSPGTFTATASMATARSSHTATLLLDGRVLIAGGSGGNTSDPDAATSTTEIYDPAKQTFTPSGNMTTARSRHTATLLPDGRVLIVGDSQIIPSLPGGLPLITTAELYDPSTGRFTSTGSLLTGRVGFNATLLANGKVLITGGVSSSTESCDAIGDAELYDPETGVFTAAGAYAGTLAKLQTGVCGFGSTSTLLPDSTVLFATEPAAQVYDPVNAAFSLKGTIFVTFLGMPFVPNYISGQTANFLLNGKVLMAGGEQEDTGRYNTALLYDAASGLFVPTGSMLRPRGYGHTATLLPDGRVLMTGGDSQMCDANNYCYYSGTESSTELYDPVDGVFSGAGNMMASRQGHTATLLNTGDVLITGGAAQGGFTTGVPFGGPGGQTGGTNYGTTASAELYHPASPASPPALFSLSGAGQGQGAIWHATTGQLATPQAPAVLGEILSMYVSGLAEGGAIPPEVSAGGRLADILYFGDAPGYPGYYQVNFRVSSSITSGSAVPVHLTYLGRPSNEVTIAVQ